MIINISVRQMIEFVMRSGDIDSSYYSSTRGVDGIKAHQKIQRAQGGDYLSEVSLKDMTEMEGIKFLVEGRADGLFSLEGLPCIDEIKSTSRSLENIEEDTHPLHWAQAKCYAWFLCKKNDLERIRVQLTYIQLEDDRIKRFVRTYEAKDLEVFYLDLLKSYLEFSKRLASYKEDLRNTAKDLKFPWLSYRRGQREMSQAIYQTICQGKNIFCDAPTGIGKTIASLFPTIKAMGEDKIDNCFYLTARNTQKQAAEDTIDLLKDRGLKIKVCILNSKERICLNDKVSCNPKDCPYAKGHYDRVNDCLINIMDDEWKFDWETIREYGEKYMVCPFELMLDISSYSQLIIGDYNYAFDPRVYLRRFLDEPTNRMVLLVDEAHNLIDRARSMYSAEIESQDIEGLIPYFEGFTKIKKAMENIIRKLLDLHTSLGSKNEVAFQDDIVDLYYPIRRLMAALDPFLSREKEREYYDQTLDLYFKLNNFIRIEGFYGEGFTREVIYDKGNIKYKIFCLDPSKPIREVLHKVQSTIYFSATLTPMNFYRDMLGESEEDYKIHLDSPFERENLLLMQMDLNTRYRKREDSLPYLVDLLHDFSFSKDGNFLIFFPSYAYMEKARDLWILRYGENRLVWQDRYMKDQERKDFIDSFTEDSDRIGLVVMGGLFSEGIDLKGDRLIGACVVSVGMPGVSFEQNLIKSYFDQKKGSGFEYAYLYPGINKCLQSAGRVIRTSKDRGAVLLLDDRFGTNNYKRLYPRHWQDMEKIGDREELKNRLADFFSAKEKEEVEEILYEKEERSRS